MATTTWILVANSRQARFFERHAGSPELGQRMQRQQSYSAVWLAT